MSPFRTALLIAAALLLLVGIVPDVGAQSGTIPLNAPGGFCVRVERDALYGLPMPDAQLIILDRSGSMDERTRAGVSRMALARDVLTQYINDFPQGENLGLRAYGFGDNCQGTQLLYAIGPADRDTLLSIVEQYAFPEGDTPIAYTLSFIPDDLRGIAGSHEVVLITDGQETCGGDPIEVARQLAFNDPNLSIHVVGFDISDAEAQQNLRGIPAVARGTYIQADTEGDLLQALSVTVRVPYRVDNSSGRYAGEGLVNRTAVQLAEGSYFVQVPDLGIIDYPIDVQRGRGVSLNVPGKGDPFVNMDDGLCVAEFCPDVPLPRLVIGGIGRVTTEDPRRQRVRTEPSLDGEILTLLDIGVEFTVLDGPICNDGYLWWLISNNIVTGWSAEGVPGAYYLEPDFIYR